MQIESRFEFEGVAIAKGLNKQVCDQDYMVEMSQELETWFHSKKKFKGHWTKPW